MLREKQEKHHSNWEKLKSRLTRINGIVLDILIVIAVIIILIGLYYEFQLRVLKNDRVNICGYSVFQVVTGSMSPTLEIGDVIVVKITKDIEIDDIIVFKDEDSFITHRLISKDGEQLITRGDANNSKDKPIKEESIIGKVKFTIPKLGIWRNYYPYILIF